MTRTHAFPATLTALTLAATGMFGTAVCSATPFPGEVNAGGVRVVASVDDIQTLIKKMSSNVELGADVVEEDETELEEAFGELRETASDSPVVRLVNQILQQAGVAVLAQANAIPQSVLQLLR